MKPFEIRPILTSDLPDLAAFLRRWRDARDRESGIQRVVHEDPAATERRLRWLLVDNPVAPDRPNHGFCVRDSSGLMRGIDVAFPSAFVAADQRLVGLCSGAFFVDPEARSLGLFLFKKYLSTPGYSFFFATTCNANSGPVWRAMGASPAPFADREYILPFKLDVMLPQLLNSRLGARNSELVGKFARGLNPVLQQFVRKPSGLSVAPFRDWEKLSDLFHRHRPAQKVTADRSPEFLEWRYGPHAPNAADIYLVQDRRGNEGWFALGHVVRGREAQIHGRILMDAVWPRHAMGFEKIFPAIVHAAAPGVDALFFQPRADVDFRACSRWIATRRVTQGIFAVPSKNGAPLSMSQFDFVPADGDSSFRISVWPESFSA